MADAAPDTARPEDYKPTGTAVARDLAFYPTPADAVDALMDQLHIKRDRPDLSDFCRSKLVPAIIENTIP